MGYGNGSTRGRSTNDPSLHEWTMDSITETLKSSPDATFGDVLYELSFLGLANSFEEDELYDMYEDAKSSVMDSEEA